MKRIELLSKTHERDSFDCGEVALNQFLQRTARQHIQKGLSRTFVLVDSEQPSLIIGFFTLSLCEVQLECLPPRWAKKYPSVVPGVKLARLGVSLNWQRQGIGGILLVEAMKRALVIAENAGVIGLFVDAKDVAVKAYYERYGFEGTKENPLLLFLPLSGLKDFIDIK
ncbi:GNAT family N-acetyltransferase [Crocosphaera sp. XPORK-15E]|uniref:GNAT family N-acetyltransferase n=1 Tax=Crocosphaera sp. XPORK-15E TaxID=3110247 RepID=UPI002B208563|nr:GNAT family N-acetyltransferase [Crocosphaera sp. XPORK-15E]MEA5534351.1 GNAT family N-acetyltransferase [Crocosphaera sp. XPORK-15E]